MIRIDTAEDFTTALQAIQPVYIQSKISGRILVPCVNTLLVRPHLVRANSYNPNSVPTEKMNLLMQSITANGFCFPVVTIWDEETEQFVIIDGAHRTMISGNDWLDLDYLPVVVLSHTIAQRMVATVQFNKARGVHQVDVDAELIRALIEQGMTDDEVAAKLGMDTESVHRYKQITGISALFTGVNYSAAWSMVETP